MNNNDIKKQLDKLRRDKRLLWLGVMFFVIVVLWILTSIFTVTKTSSISPELIELAKSFVPRLESKVFDEIATKKAFSGGELSDFPIYIFDKKSIDGNGNLINIMAMNNKESSESGTQPKEENKQIEEDIETIESSMSAEEVATPSPTPAVSETSSQESGYLPIPLEAIIGSQN